MAARHGAWSLAAVDPSQSFVSATRKRLPEEEIRLAAEALAFPSDSFDLALAGLVCTSWFEQWDCER